MQCIIPELHYYTENFNIVKVRIINSYTQFKKYFSNGKLGMIGFKRGINLILQSNIHILIYTINGE